MSGFSGGQLGQQAANLQQQVQPPATQATQGVGPGEAQRGAPYGQQGTYNTLARDMSRGFMGGYNFGPMGQFSYQPYGNPYMQGGMFGNSPYNWGGPQRGLRSGFGQFGGLGMGNVMGGMFGGQPRGYYQPSFQQAQLFGGGQGGGMGPMMMRY